MADFLLREIALTNDTLTAPILTLSHVSKSFPGVRALHEKIEIKSEKRKDGKENKKKDTKTKKA